jgi:hypothetical protein
MELERHVKAELSRLTSETIPQRRKETEELEREIRVYFVVVHEETKKDEELVRVKELEGNEPPKGVMKKREEKKVEDEERQCEVNVIKMNIQVGKVVDAAKGVKSKVENTKKQFPSVISA